MPVENVEGVYYHGAGMEMMSEPALRKEVVLQPAPVLPRHFKGLVPPRRIATLGALVSG